MNETDYSKVASSESPIDDSLTSQGDEGWTMHCKFCPESFTAVTKYEARSAVHRHAKKHWCPPAGLFMNDGELARWGRHRDRYKQIMGDAETTRAMNQAGL